MHYTDLVECTQLSSSAPEHTARSMRYLTIRSVSPDLATALEQEKSARGTSMNRTILDILERAVGIGGAKRSNGLAQLAGTWSDEEHARFEEAIAVTEQVDEELWQ